MELAGWAPGEPGWPWAREAQAAALALPATGRVTAIDIGAEADIHPRNKQDVGRRLAQVALRDVHGRNVAAEGPRLRGVRFEGGQAIVAFDVGSDRLATRGGARAVRGFVAAGEDGVFHPASARIEGADTVVVECPEVPAPVAVRYAWAGFPDATLINDAGLPAFPFRTDDRPRVP